MRRQLVTLATLLLLSQGLYSLYLLAAADLFLLPGFPYRLFSLSLFNEDSIYLRGLLLGVIVRIHYERIVTWLQGEGAWARLLGYLIVSGLFLFFDRFLGLYTTLGLLPALLGLLFLPELLQPSLPAFAITKLQQYKNTPYSIALPTRDELLPINNPQRGIYVLGNQGSGKTRYVFEPILYQMIKKGYAGVLYAYGFEATPLAPDKSYCLTKFAYNCFLRHQPLGMRFQVINFTHLTSTARINPCPALH